MSKREQRIKRLADLGSIVQDNKDFINMVLPGNEAAPKPPTPAPQAPNTSTAPFNTDAAQKYNNKSKETYQKHDAEIKRILGTTSDWATPEFAKAVYDWQQKNGLTGKWIDGKLGPVTIAAMAKNDPSLKENYGEQAISPFLPDGKVKLRLTGYWPFTARPDEQKMEGGIFDRKMPEKFKNQPDSPQYQQHVLHTVEQHLANPAKHPFVSLSGDDAIWPYGQELIIPWTDGKTIRGRVVDTGGHFRGAGKVYRTPGEEPIDVCVQSSKTKVPPHVVAQVVGDVPKQQQPPSVAQYKAMQRIKYATRKAKMLTLHDDEK